MGRIKGGFTSKIHALMDAHGNPLRFRITGGNRNDITQASQMIEGFEKACVLGDKGYDSDTFISKIESQNCEAVIPPSKRRALKRQYDKELYKERNLVERFFSKIKNFRRVFSRFDKMARNYLAFIQIASVLIWLK